MQISPSAGTLVTLQDAKTTGNGEVIAPPPSFNRHTVIVKGATDVSAGKVKVEAADAPDYAGTWALIGSEVTVGNGTEQIVSFTGIYPFIRARISTEVSGATVTVKYVGAP